MCSSDLINQQHQLAEAMQYHDKQQSIKDGMMAVKKLIEKRLNESIEEHDSQENDDADDFVPIGIANDMNDLRACANKAIEEECNIEDYISKFNEDQLRIFKKITDQIISGETSRFFVSGPGGTGKSHLIRGLVLWNRVIRGKKTAVAAPTGIAAYNISGLTLHRLLQFPYEKEGKPVYKELSANALKKVRETFEDLDLIIIDEVSMVSNAMLAFIHLRLQQIFNTTNTQDGWFGKKHVVFFGDLFQLPPVDEPFAFIEVDSKTLSTRFRGLFFPNLWELLEYDELTINMRQKDDQKYYEILSRIRLGLATNSDIAVLQTRLIKLLPISTEQSVDMLCEYLMSLPSNTVCIFSLKRMCKVLNEAMLNKIDSEIIILNAIDECNIKRKSDNMKKKINEVLDDDDEKNCCIAKVIKIKIGSKIMIRRNINFNAGLVTGSIATVISVKRGKNKDIETIKVKLSDTGKEYDIERFDYQFMVTQNVFVTRRQFPIRNSYAITAHSSQGLSLDNVVADAGNTIFADGQTYVILSRVKKK